MTVNYTTNLSLGQPVTGTESGTWGDDVNNAVTSYLDIAIAGGLAITITTTDVTLSITQGTSSATNIGSTTAQYAILNVSGAMTAARNLIVPSSSRIYLINNNTTGGFALTVKGSATSGVTLVNGEKAHVFWNGTDYAKLSNASGGAGVFSSITNSGLTSGRVVYSTTGGLETDSANLTFNGTTLTANTIGAFTLSGTIAGGGNQINNVIIGTSTPLAGAFTTLSATGVATFSAGSAAAPAITTTGDTNTGIFFPAADTIAFSEGGAESMRIDSSGNLLVGTTTLNRKVTVGVASAATLAATDDGVSVLNATTKASLGVTGSSFTYQGIQASAGLLYSLTGLSIAADSSNPITFVTGGSERMRIDSSGNLGIGTTSPTQKLSIQGASFVSSSFNGQAIGDASAERIRIGYKNGTPDTGLVPAQIIADSVLLQFASRDNVSGAITFATGTGIPERMRLDYNGNLGIGVTTPGAKLDVNGAITMSASATTKLSWSNSGAYLNWIECGGTSGSNYMRFATGNTEAMRLDSSGNLGIGTTAPSQKLTVAVADTGQALQLRGATGYVRMRPYVDATNGAIIDATNAAESAYGVMTIQAFTLKLLGNNATGATIDSSGNLGIGTTSPSVASGTGVAIYSSSVARLTLRNSTTGDASTDGSGLFVSGSDFGIENREAGNIIFYNASECMRIDSAGNVQVKTGAVMPYAPAPAAISAAATLTNANIQGQIISATGTTYTITMPLGTTLETLATWVTTNIAYDFYVINTATGVITMAGNTGVTTLGSLTVGIGASAHFRIRRTAANTFVLYRLV